MMVKKVKLFSCLDIMIYFNVAIKINDINNNYIYKIINIIIVSRFVYLSIICNVFLFRQINALFFWLK